MKKLVCILAAAALAAAMGCAKPAPEDAAREIVEKQIATKHEGFILDSSDLDYDVVEEGEDFARVAVTGTIEVTGEIGLVKEGGRWVPGARIAAPQKAQAPTQPSAPGQHAAGAGGSRQGH